MSWLAYRIRQDRQEAARAFVGRKGTGLFFEFSGSKENQGPLGVFPLTSTIVSGRREKKPARSGLFVSVCTWLDYWACETI
jgi:hypothetical protein